MLFRLICIKKAVAPIRILCVFLFVFTAAVKISALTYFSENLPENTREALQQLKEGTLDSTVWEMFREFYDDPISVPLGELNLLLNVMPYLDKNYPVTSKQLSVYEPWKRKDVERFFNDFPELNALKPVLSFDARSFPQIARVRFDSRTSGVNSVARQSVRINTTPSFPLSFAGFFDFENSHARWRRRNISFNAGRINFQAGNFILRDVSNLLFGHFTEDAEKDSSVSDNWLYGGVSSYNGIAADLMYSNIRGNMFLHKQKGESAAGISVYAKPLKWLGLQTGFYGIDADYGMRNRDTTAFGSVGLSAGYKNFETGLETGVSSQNSRSIPVALHIKTSLPVSSYLAQVVIIPETFNAPLSRWKYDFLNNLDLPDSAAEDIAAAYISGSVKNRFGVKYSYKLGYTAGESRSATAVSADISGKFPFDYSVGYSTGTISVDTMFFHKINIFAGKQFHSRLNMNSSIRADVDGSGGWCFYVRTGADFEALPYVSLLPYLNYSYSGDNVHSLTVEYCQRMLLFEKNFGEFSVSVPLISVETRGVIIHVASSFLF